MALIIDPPVGPFHSVREIREWIESLNKLATEHPGDEDAQDSIRREVARARGWIAQQETE